jgi:hypothetical protein
MLTSDDKLGGWVKKGQNHDDVILEWSLKHITELNEFLQGMANIKVGHVLSFDI